jgi:hypothetical protein
MSATRPNDARRFTLSSFACCAITVCVITLAGCGDGSGLQRIEVTGDLSWGDGMAPGEPVAKALISFLPVNDGPPVSAGVEDGHYRFNSKTGPIAGLHRVIVSVESAPMGEGPAIDPTNKNGSLRQWKFQFEVPKTGPVTHNITLDDV